MDINKAAGIDNLSSKFLKNGSNILVKPNSKVCNLSVKILFSQQTVRLPNSKYYTKKVPQHLLEINGQFHDSL